MKFQPQSLDDSKRISSGPISHLSAESAGGVRFGLASLDSVF